MSYLIGTEAGHNLYKKYLSISLENKSKVSAINGAGYIRESKCSREKYASNKALYVFESICKKLPSVKDQEMLLVYYGLNGNNNVRSFNSEDYNSYKTFINKYEEIIETQLSDLLSDKGSILLKDKPSELTKSVYAEEVRPEVYTYLSFIVDIPESSDMITNEVIETVKRHEKYFYYFTKITREEHSIKAKKMMKNIMKTL